jgi:release factor glutamine methyltransferase
MKRREGNRERSFVDGSPLLFAAAEASFGADEAWAASPPSSFSSPLSSFGCHLSSFDSPLPSFGSAHASFGSGEERGEAAHGRKMADEERAEPPCGGANLRSRQGPPWVALDFNPGRSCLPPQYTSPVPTIAALLAEARPLLAATPFGASRREAALLLGHVLDLSEARLLAHQDREVPPDAEGRFRGLLARRLTGEPVSYLFNEREFFGRPFYVDSRVLIPRPETEHVVEEALKEALPPSPRILDVGAGSGCLAITLALEVPGSRAVTTDLSPGALAVAARNARRLGVAERVSLVRMDLTDGLDLSRFDLVVSNPPYVDRSEIPEMSIEVCNFEPQLALFPPGAGDSVLARLFARCAELRPGVALVVEIGRGQLDAARRHAEASGLDLVRVRHDYSGIPRVLVLRRSSIKEDAWTSSTS